MFILGALSQVMWLREKKRPARAPPRREPIRQTRPPSTQQRQPSTTRQPKPPIKGPPPPQTGSGSGGI